MSNSKAASFAPAAVRLDDRAREVLRYVVQRYLEDGQPVGSRTLANHSSMSFSSATIRNVMADLEELGFLVSRHTSAGRVPSPRGIRFFIDRLLKVTPPSQLILHQLQTGLCRDTLTEVQTAAAAVISQLTKHAGFVVIPASPAPVIRKLHFVKLSSSRVLSVIVTDSGDVQNRVFIYDYDVSERELNAAASVYNRYFVNMTFAQAQSHLHGQVLELRGQIRALLKSLLDKADGRGEESSSVLHFAGEMNLLKDEDLAGDMRKLRDLYDLLERKKELIRLLVGGDAADNVRVFIGSESGLAALDECSVVFSSCGGRAPLGLIGVVGPKRMRYSRVIPTVQVAAKFLGGALEDLC